MRERAAVAVLVQPPNEKFLRLRIAEGDFPGSETGGDVTNYSKAYAVLLCYDITDRESFEALKGSVKTFKEHSRPGAVLMVVGLRYDEKDRVAVAGNEGKVLW